MVLPCAVVGAGDCACGVDLVLSICDWTCSFVYIAVPLFVHICCDQCRWALIVFAKVFSHPGHFGAVTCALSGFRV